MQIRPEEQIDLEEISINDAEGDLEEPIDYNEVEISKKPMKEVASELTLGLSIDQSNHTGNDETASSPFNSKNHKGGEDADQQSDRAALARKFIFGILFLIGFAMCFVELDGNRMVNQTLAIAIWVSGLWLTELVPLVVTALMPLFLFPMFGIVSSKTIAAAYINNTIFLFISGMLLSQALERWNLHRRFSLKVLSWCGAKPGSLLFGMMFSTFILSMFVSNTATALMMVPNAISVCESLPGTEANDAFGIAVMLGIAYAANVGGMASLIGTPPNLVFQAQLEVIFPDAPEVTFAQWMGFGLPMGFGVLIVTWIYLKILYLRNFQGNDNAMGSKDIFVQQYKDLGRWTFEQTTVAGLFSTLAMLWVFRGDMEFSSFSIKGWSNIFPYPEYISDATIGMCISILLFLIPARSASLPDAAADVEDDDDAKKKRFTTTLLDAKQSLKALPFDIIFLFGGGFALAEGFVSSGLSTYLGETLGGMNVSLPFQVWLMAFFISWLTCLTSNTATSSIMIPISASIAVGAGVSPYTFMIPTALACSCAFCLPVATPPNMVVFASGKVPMSSMMKAGVFLNILCSVVILGLTFTLVPSILKVGADELPEWAETAAV